MNAESDDVPICPGQQTIATSQGNLSFRSRGEGEVILFLHGLLGSAKAWAYQFAALSPAYQVMTRDAPGYGESALVVEDIGAYEQMLHERVLTCGDQKISLMGHSMGGTVASRYAARHAKTVQRARKRTAAVKSTAATARDAGGI